MEVEKTFDTLKAALKSAKAEAKTAKDTAAFALMAAKSVQKTSYVEKALSSANLSLEAEKKVKIAADAFLKKTKKKEKEKDRELKKAEEGDNEGLKKFAKTDLEIAQKAVGEAQKVVGEAQKVVDEAKEKAMELKKKLQLKAIDLLYNHYRFSQKTANEVLKKEKSNPIYIKKFNEEYNNNVASLKTIFENKKQFKGYFIEIVGIKAKDYKEDEIVEKIDIRLKNTLNDIKIEKDEDAQIKKRIESYMLYEITANALGTIKTIVIKKDVFDKIKNSFKEFIKKLEGDIDEKSMEKINNIIKAPAKQLQPASKLLPDLKTLAEKIAMQVLKDEKISKDNRDKLRKKYDAKVTGLKDPLKGEKQLKGFLGEITGKVYNETEIVKDISDELNDKLANIEKDADTKKKEMLVLYLSIKMATKGLEIIKEKNYKIDKDLFVKIKKSLNDFLKVLTKKIDKKFMEKIDNIIKTTAKQLKKLVDDVESKTENLVGVLGAQYDVNNADSVTKDQKKKAKETTEKEIKKLEIAFNEASASMTANLVGDDNKKIRKEFVKLYGKDNDLHSNIKEKKVGKKTLTRPYAAGILGLLALLEKAFPGFKELPDFKAKNKGFVETLKGDTIWKKDDEKGQYILRELTKIIKGLVSGPGVVDRFGKHVMRHKLPYGVGTAAIVAGLGYGAYKLAQGRVLDRIRYKWFGWELSDDRAKEIAEEIIKLGNEFGEDDENQAVGDLRDYYSADNVNKIIEEYNRIKGVSDTEGVSRVRPEFSPITIGG